MAEPNNHELLNKHGCQPILLYNDFTENSKLDADQISLSKEYGVGIISVTELIKGFNKLKQKIIV